MSKELNKASVEQAEPASCQGNNCGTTTGDHSSECLAEAAASQGWELKPGDLCGRDCPMRPAPAEQAGGDERDLQGAQGGRDGWGPFPIVQVPWNVFDRAVMWVEDRRRYGDDGTIVDDWKALKTIQRAALAQPSPAQAEQAEAERPDVVAVVRAQGFGRVCEADANTLYQHCSDGDELMTVAQHAASVARWAEMFNRVEQERDAALARVAEVETMVRMLEEREWAEHVGESELGQRLEAAITTLINEASEFGDMPKDWRVVAKSNCFVLMEGNSVIASLAGPQSELNAARIAGALSKAPPAQAQHSVPEEFSFEYRHPNGECHTVTVSRDQVINEMPDFLFEALCSKFCNCEPAGETNVVECCCDEYAEEFKLLAAAPAQAQHSVPEGWMLVECGIWTQEQVDEMQKTVARFRNSEFVDDRALAMAVADAGQCKAPEISLAELLAAAPGKEVGHE